MPTETIFNGTYAVQIRQRKDGDYETTFMYNAVEGNLREANVWNIKVYKSEKTARNKAEKFLKL